MDLPRPISSLQPAPLPTSDDLADLHRQVVELQQALAKSEHDHTNLAHRDMQETLAMQVRERTAELEKTVIALQEEVERRVLAESALKASEQCYQSLYEQNPFMYFTLAPDGIVLSVNHFGAEQLGYRKDDLIGQSILQVFDAKDRQIVLGQLAACIASPYTVFQWEIQKIRNDGTSLWVKERARAIHSDTGRPLVLAVCEDITERKRTEDQVRESEARWKALYEHAGVGIAQLGLDGRFLRVNPQLCKTLGHTSEKLLQQTFQELTHPDDLDLILAYLQELLNGTRYSFSMEKRYRRNDNTWVWVELTVSLVHTASGTPAYFIAVIQPINDRKQAEQQLRESEQAIRSLLEATSRLGLTLDERIDTVLELGARHFGLPLGFVTNVEGDQLELTHIYDPQSTLRPGQRFPIHETYCCEAMQSTDVIAFEHARTSNWSQHPAYQKGTECYIGTALIDRYRPYGTIGFAGPEPHPHRFTQADKDFLQLMARWVTGELSRNESEQAVKEQEALLRSVIETATDAIFMKDRDGRYRFINSAGAAVIGRPAADIIGKKDDEIFPPETAHRLMADDESVFLGSVQRRFEAVIPLGGATRTFYSIKAPHRDQAEHIVGLVGVSRDMTDIRRAEQALRASELKFRTFVETTRDWVWEVNEHAVYTYASPRIQDILGYTPEEVLGKTPFDLMPPNEAVRVAGLFGPIAAAQRPFTLLQNANRHKDGRLVLLECSGTPIFDEAGIFRGYHGIDRDITDRKQTEEALRKSEERFKIAFRSNPGPVIITELDSGRCLEVNEAGLRLFGYSRAEVIGQTTLTLGLWPSQNDRMCFIQQLEADGGIRNREILLRTKDHRVLTLQVSSEVIELNGVRCLITIGNNVTEHKRAEEALRTSELRLQRFVAEAPVGLFILDQSWRAISANKALCELTGYEEHEIIGSTYALYTHPDDLAANIALTDEFFRGVRSHYTYEKRYVRKTGEIIWVSVKATKVDLSGYEGPLLLAAVQDITERKLAMDERAQLSRDLHDNMLQALYAIGMQLEAGKLVMGRSPRRSKIHLTHAVDQLNNLMLDVRRFITLLTERTPAELDFGQALRQLITSISGACQAAPELNIDNPVLSFITPKLGEQLLNIAREALSNSIRHAQASHRWVRLNLTDNTIHLVIGDNGIGFLMTRKRRPGHGLGNMAARAKQIHATFSLKSAPGKGTTVSIIVPLQREQVYE